VVKMKPDTTRDWSIADRFWVRLRSSGQLLTTFAVEVVKSRPGAAQYWPISDRFGIGSP